MIGRNQGSKHKTNNIKQLKLRHQIFLIPLKSPEYLGFCFYKESGEFHENFRLIICHLLTF